MNKRIYIALVVATLLCMGAINLMFNLENVPFKLMWYVYAVVGAVVITGVAHLALIYFEWKHNSIKTYTKENIPLHELRDGEVFFFRFSEDYKVRMRAEKSNYVDEKCYYCALAKQGKCIVDQNHTSCEGWARATGDDIICKIVK